MSTVPAGCIRAASPRTQPGTGQCSRLAIGAAEGYSEVTADTMKLAADNVQSVIIPGSGHYCLEEAPDEVLKALTAFLAPGREST